MGIRRLPTTLDEALDELERDQVLMEALGSMQATAYLAVKRNEIDFFKEKTRAAALLQILDGLRCLCVSNLGLQKCVYQSAADQNL